MSVSKVSHEVHVSGEKASWAIVKFEYYEDKKQLNNVWEVWEMGKKVKRNLVWGQH